MSRPRRYFAGLLRPVVVECVCRTIQGRLLLKPTPEVEKIILGIIGRALSRYKGAQIIEFTVLGNHYHMDFLFDTVETMADVFEYINGLLAKKVAGKIHGWKARTWSRRYRHTEVLDEAAMVDRTRYVLMQGVRHNLVAWPWEWPGPSSVRARLYGEKLVGVWYDETAMYRARRAGRQVNPEDFATEYEIKLAPMPCWEDLSEEQYRDNIKHLLKEAILDKHLSWIMDRTCPFGVKAIAAQDPWDIPKNVKISPAPLCHTSTERQKQAYLAALRAFTEQYESAAEQQTAGHYSVAFPDYCFPPARPFERPVETDSLHSPLADAPARAPPRW